MPDASRPARRSVLDQTLLYGGDYSPEQWSEEVWLEDVRLMGEAGVNMVSLGVFGWAKLEPRPGEYDFGWLDRAMNLLHAHSVRVNLATATASPPPWLARLHPESLPVTRDAVTLGVGARQQYCPSSPAYREAARRLVTCLAERYRDHPALAMWHVNNEYGCHVSECFCGESARHFRHWLERRYGTLEVLNDAWGTAFWSQGYGDWAEVNPPGAAPTFLNPSQQLDWKRFCSDALLECFELERAVLRKFTPEVPVTTNFIGVHKPLDGWVWAGREDVVSVDIYPNPASTDAPVELAFQADVTRSLGNGRPWVLMEQTPSLVQWRDRNPVKRPGVMRLWSHAAVARGANGVMFFQWRQSLAGAEKFHGAMVPHAGTNTRVWREVVSLGAEMKRLAPLLETRVEAEAAILLDWESWWALELDAKPSSGVTLLGQIASFYGTLWRRNVAVDFTRPGADLSRYKLVLAPNLYLVRDGLAADLERFVSGGGTLVMGFFSGIVDERDRARPGGYPAPFRELLGLRVEEFDPYPAGRTNAIRLPDGAAFACDLWSDVVELEGAEALATYERDFYAGRAAVTRHGFGRGASYYLGTHLDEAGMAWLLERACREAGLNTLLAAPAGVEIVRRSGEDSSFTFFLNHNPAPVEVLLPAAARDLLTGEWCADTLQLGSYGVAVLEAEVDA